MLYPFLNSGYLTVEGYQVKKSKLEFKYKEISGGAGECSSVAAGIGKPTISTKVTGDLQE